MSQRTYFVRIGSLRLWICNAGRLQLFLFVGVLTLQRFYLGGHDWLFAGSGGVQVYRFLALPGLCVVRDVARGMLGVTLFLVQGRGDSLQVTARLSPQA